MINAQELRSHFAQGIAYDQYVSKGTPDQQANWSKTYDRVQLTPAQLAVTSGFVRRINVLVSSGLWCGDCAHQCPMLAKIALASQSAVSKSNPEEGGVDLRFLDRDARPDFRDAFKICAGTRVPTVVFMAEDHEFIGVLGDKTLSRLRAKAAKALGASCPIPGAELPQDELNATLQDWVNEFERVHLTLRLSTRLRTQHDD